MSILMKNINIIGLNNEETEEVKNLVIDDKGIIKRKKKSIDYERTLDLKDYYLSPGWIDFHTHVFYGISNLGINPDRIGPRTGVTALVDAGSAGEVNFLGFREYIIKTREYPIFSFINIGSIGLILANEISELDSLNKIRIDDLINCINNNRDYIKGIKLRACRVILRGLGVEVVKLAKKIAEEVKLPLMVHVGEPLPLLEDILSYLDEGDIVTHLYHGKRWGIFEGDSLIPTVREAYDRGVKFDLGHGRDSFNYKVAEKALKKDLKPFTISTDLHQGNIEGPVWDLATTLSKMISFGLTLDEVIQMVSINPAEILKVETYREGLFNKKARLTIFKIDKGDFALEDSNGNVISINRFIRPIYSILGNKLIKAGTNFKSI